MPDIVLLQREVEVLMEVACEFWANYQSILDTAASLAEKRGKHYDTTPIHHRFSVVGLVHEILKKGKRIESVANTFSWNADEDMVKVLVREAPDIVNYAAFLGAFALQLLADLGADEGAIQRALDPELGETAETFIEKYGR